MTEMQASGRLLRRHPLGFGKNDFPRWSLAAGRRRLHDYKHLSQRVRELKILTRNCHTVDELHDRLIGFPEFKADQKRIEILNLLKILQKEQPRYVCEIGTSFGGTLFLLTRVSAPNAIVISIDLGLSFVRSKVHARMKKNGQKIFCLRLDSRSAEAHGRVKAILRGHQLDFLLIDGDHSLEGVESDFCMYAPLVRKGGLIALHDIVPDYSTRCGFPTGTWTGGVPEFWRKQKPNYFTEELIEDHDQDGYGLGLIHV